MTNEQEDEAANDKIYAIAERNIKTAMAQQQEIVELKATITTLRERLAAAEASLDKFMLASRLGRKFLYQLGSVSSLAPSIHEWRTEALQKIDELEREGNERLKPQPQAETAEER